MKIKLYAAVAAFVLAPAPAAASPPPSEWPQAGYGPGNTYYNPGETHLNGATIGGIRQRWAVPTHSAAHCEVGGAPVLAGGRVFSTDPGGLGAYDPATGARRWHVELPQTTVWRLAVADRKLIVLSSACRVPTRFQSNLTAYEPATGARIWSTGLAKYSFDLRIDRGVVALDSNQDGLASTIAYGVADGKFRWLRRGDRGDGLISAGGRLLLRRESGGAVAVSITDGRTLWQTPANWYAVGSDPAGSRFYVGGPGLTAVDAATGRPLWTSPLEAFAVTSDERHVYFGRARSVECLDAATGRKLWSVHLPGLAGRSVRAGGLLYVAGATLEVRNAATGKPEKSGIAGSVDRPPVVADGRLFVTDGDQLRAYY